MPRNQDQQAQPSVARGPLVRRCPSDLSCPGSGAARGLLVLAIAALLYVGREAFVPVALAILLALILSGPVEALHARRMPRALSAILTMTTMLSLFAGALNLMSIPAQQWFAAAPQTLKNIGQKVHPLAKVLNRVDEIRNSAGSMGSPARTAGASAPTPSASAQMVIFESTRGVLVNTVTIVILTVFLLAGGPPMMARMTSAFAADLQSAHDIEIIEKLRHEVGRFYMITALINLGLGCATALVMLACGMPNPLLWGGIAAILNFIPYAGATTTLILLTAVAIVSFDSPGRVFAVVGGYLALATIEGQIVQPLLVGRRLALNPLLVFLALWFGGFFWGIAGIILATPVLMTMKVIAEHSRGGTPLLGFLGPEPGD